MLDIKAGIRKNTVRIANREDHDQTASQEAVGSWSALFVYRPLQQATSLLKF